MAELVFLWKSAFKLKNNFNSSSSRLSTSILLLNALVDVRGLLLSIDLYHASNANRLSSALFFEEFSTLAEQLAVAPGNLLIVGDFNFHVDNPGNTDAIKYTSILESFNFKQHVRGHTHKKGHTLDLLIARADDDLFTSIDHLAVHCKLRLQKPPLERASIQYRKIRSIDIDSFNDDRKKSTLLSRNHNDLPSLLDEYENTLLKILDKYAPMKRRMITLRPSAPWYMDEIREEKKKRRRLERRWRSSRLCIDRQLYADQCKLVNNMLKLAKSSYYSSIISDNTSNQKILFNTIDKLLHRRPEKRYPTTSSTVDTANNFAEFFHNKIVAIQDALSSEPSLSDHQICLAEEQSSCELAVFQTVPVKVVWHLIDVTGLKSCDLDPVPAHILKGCKSTLLPTLTRIVNLSLQSACMPGQLKEAMVRPKLKKESLNFEEYSNFRPISNLKFVSKIIEKAVAVQVKNYITDNDLDESLQSAYTHLHSTETALLKVQNDILCTIDDNKCVALLLLDMSSAFDTVDHRLQTVQSLWFKRTGSKKVWILTSQQKAVRDDWWCKIWCQRSSIWCSTGVGPWTDPVLAVYLPSGRYCKTPWTRFSPIRRRHPTLPRFQALYSRATVIFSVYRSMCVSCRFLVGA